MLVTLEEAARRLRVSRATLYRWSRAGRLRLYRVGPRATRVREEDLERLERQAPPIHEDELWQATGLLDAQLARSQVEAEIPGGDLRTYLAETARAGVAVRWNPHTEEFDEA